MTLRLYMVTKESKPIIAEIIPDEYKEFGDLFNKKLKIGLPEYKIWDHEIPLKKGKEPKFMAIYPIIPEKNKTLRKYLEKNL
jgi:hypothetical protein